MMEKLQNYLPKFILALMIISAFLLMLGPARQDSAIMDELAHIPAGYSYVKYFDYRLNPEHPPLVKALSAIPLVFQNLNFPADKSSWQTDVNGQWAAGAQFLYESGNNADKIIFWSRLVPILLTLLLIGFVYFWASELMGRWWALLPAALTALSPNFLAHGHYVTTDIGASLGFLVATYFFLKFIYTPSNKNTIIAGLAFGFAELLKFSCVLLVPFFILITAIVFLEKTVKEVKSPITDKFRRIAKHFWLDFGRLALIFIIGGLLIYAVYFVFTFNYPVEKQHSDTAFILQSFGKRWLADPVIAMTQNSVLRPLAHYLLGVLMVMQRSSGGNTAYFLGEVSGAGSRLYFPLVFLMKETLPALAIILIAFLSGFSAMLKASAKGWAHAKNKISEYVATNLAELSMIIIAAGYWTYSLMSPLNIGFRHIMPTLPFIYILAAGSLRKMFSAAQPFSRLTVKYLALFVLAVWLIAGAVFVYPYFLSRFNELSGGTYGGYKYVTDSNFDWGQDLKRLQDWANNPPNGEKVDKIAVDYFGGGNIAYYFGNKAEGWNSAMGNPIEDGIKWLAISINTIQGATAKAAPGFERNPQDEYLWLKNPLSPDYKAGSSIFIYKLGE